MSTNNEPENRLQCKHNKQFVDEVNGLKNRYLDWIATAAYYTGMLPSYGLHS